MQGKGSHGSSKSSKYYTTLGGDNWRFHCIVKDKHGNKKPLYLKRASDTLIRLHIKVKSEANPFDPRFREYFMQRAKKQKTKLTTQRLVLPG